MSGAEQPGDLTTAAALVSFRRRLNAWYRQHARPLPWRETSDPYSIWVSEIMLQQTTVAAVIPFYHRFLTRFPTVRQLADASEEEVLQYWEGLGYYSRGRNLRKAAIEIVNQFDGEFPRAVADLERLPGIGRYTAGAIRSFAFDLPAPIVEANTQRLYARLIGLDGDVASASGKSALWSFAERLQPKKSAGKLNQALMELGAQVCTVSNPRCEQCPVPMHCQAFATGRQETIPTRKARPQLTHLVEATCAIHRDDRFLVRLRQPDERWAGLWDFPRFELSALKYEDRSTQRRIHKLIRECEESLRQELAVSVTQGELVHELKHGVTRYAIRLFCLTWELEGPTNIPGDRFSWKTLTELETTPMPVTGRKFVSWLKRRKNRVP